MVGKSPIAATDPDALDQAIHRAVAALNSERTAICWATNESPLRFSENSVR